MSIPVSVVVLTKDEEVNIADCLSSLDWCDDIHVVDSGSTDSTCEIVKTTGAKLHSHPFESFGQQRNWALDNCSFSHEWIFFLDADEQTTPRFIEELEKSVSEASDDTAGYYCCWKTMLYDRWLKRSDGFPRWQFRIVRKGFSRFEDFGHTQREKILRGAAEYLREPYLHFPFNKGWTVWWDRHNNYAAREASLRLERKPSLKEIFSEHPPVRIKSLKSLVSRVPGWPLLHFLIRYLFGLGFLEGRAGLIFCINMAYYEFMIQLKMESSRQLSLVRCHQ